MKTTLKLFSFILFAFLVTICNAQEDLINDEFPEAKQEVIETFGAIAQSIKDGDVDKLISFHAYGPKFTEFNDGELRYTGEENESHERAFFGETVDEGGVLNFAADDLQVAVYYGNVANLTFHSNFLLVIGGEEVKVRKQITLLFVKTKGEWKMVHEHHSDLKAGL